MSGWERFKVDVIDDPLEGEGVHFHEMTSFWEAAFFNVGDIL